MKTQIQIRTGDFEYIMQEFEGSSEEAVEAFNALKKTFKGEVGEGLSDKEWRMWLDNYLINHTGDGDIHARMSKQQMWMIKEIRNAVTRIKRKNGDEYAEQALSDIG